MDRMAELLGELSKIFDIPLHIDSFNSCTLLVNEKLRVQMEQEKAQERLIIAAFIGTISPGKFRENVLSTTLRANHLYPRLGVFGYHAYSNQLALFHYLSLAPLNGEKLADFLSLFIPKAAEWQKAIESGNIRGLIKVENTKLPSPLGLIR